MQNYCKTNRLEKAWSCSGSVPFTIKSLSVWLTVSLKLFTNVSMYCWNKSLKYLFKFTTAFATGFHCLRARFLTIIFVFLSGIERNYWDPALTIKTFTAAFIEGLQFSLLLPINKSCRTHCTHYWMSFLSDLSVVTSTYSWSPKNNVFLFPVLFLVDGVDDFSSFLRPGIRSGV